ncbi:ABC transporter ATP-binding protein [Parablautia muri]|uniref:ABC transporter ATP-binding protein n=1 Tax=Parablautia muri TaxID=2320879 RepID=UPI0024128307|nr:ATP-binding cassette domain-containing protein [Parablautia muri]
MITVNNLSKTYRIVRPREGRFSALKSLVHPEYIERRAVDGIHFSIKDGEIVGYIGQNGAGKSTTIKMLSGILVPTSGEVYVDGLIPHRDRKEHLHNIGVVFGQKTSLWWDVPVIDSLHILKKMYRVEDERFQKNLALFTELLDLGNFLNQPVRQLSLGQRVRADLAAALMHDPKILFLDEPTIGVDVVAKERLRKFILEINRERGVSVLLTTHDVVDMEKLVNRVIVIHGGRLIYDGAIHGLRERYGRQRRMELQFENEPPDLTLPGVDTERMEDGGLAVMFDQNAYTVDEMLSHIRKTGSTIRDIIIQKADIEQIVRDIYQEGGRDV